MISTRAKGFAASVVTMAVLLCCRPADARQADTDEGTSPGPTEVVRLLDAYAVVQAQDMLQLDDQQYPRFVQRFRALQDARRRTAQARLRLLQDLQRQTRRDAREGDAVWRQGLADLKSLEDRGREEVARSLAALDEVLSLRQQVRFRLFEEQMERRKLELMARARQAVRPGARRPVR
ncbi:MAG: hypothetical protein AB7I50_11775 [Vicinamibacterales bacterium]